ncbi:hypothetical protein E4T56_gene1575 [Termitomyces sp. T112]|nr:hypothetical protein E4T56_gene1575 [Termitomyces sp. T112]
MNDRRNSDPIFHSTSLNASSRRASGRSQSSSAGKRYQDDSSRSSGHYSTYEDLAKSLKQPLSVTNRRLKGQECRAADTEEHILALERQLKLVNDARVAAIQEASKASEELRLYKIQLRKAHQEIQRAREIIDKVDKERYDAEKTAAEARSLARRYQRDLLIIKAMEEGRNVGMQEGLEHGRALTLLETDEDMYEEGYAREYLDYADPELRSDPSRLASNEEVVVISPQRSNIEPVSQPPPQPIPVPPPDPVRHIPTTRPQFYRSPSPSVVYPTVSMPPDGYIPTIDPDNVIRIPPPHELARPPPTPERPASPQLPELSQEEPRPSSRSHRRRQSNSSFIPTSTFSNAAGPVGRVTLLSAIPEAQSPYASPVPVDGNTLRRQPSQVSSYHSNSVNPEQGNGAGPLPPVETTGINRRLSASQALRTCGSKNENHRKSTSSVSPPRPLSSAFLSQPVSSSGGMENSRRKPEALPISMPGAYRDSRDQTLREHTHPGSSDGHRLIDDDVTSVGSVDMSTTSQVRRHQPRASLDSSSALPIENHSMTGWEDAVRNAGSHIPVPYDNRTSGSVPRNIDRGNK